MASIRQAKREDLPAIETLLAGADLTQGGVAEIWADFFVAEAGGEIVGAGGFEACGGGMALLRSFVVEPRHRGRGIARGICERVIEACRRSGVTELYLLTITAQDYFAKLGFAAMPRAEVPDPIRRTAQFSSLCPASAIVMYWSAAAAGASPDEVSRRHFESGYFCAESVLLAVSKHCGIESPLIPSIATGFCSGVSRTSGMCGALTGGILALNLAYGRDRAQESVEQNYAAVQRLVAAFAALHGSTNCCELLGCHLGTPEGRQLFRERGLHARCAEFTASAAALAAGLVDEFPVRSGG